MIACRMPLEGISDGVSTATLYRWLRWDYQQSGTVHRHLQRAFKPYKRAYGLKRWRNRYKDENQDIYGRLRSVNLMSDTVRGHIFGVFVGPDLGPAP